MQIHNKTPEDYTQKSYEGVEFHKTYGAEYWLGEFMVVLTAYVIDDVARRLHSILFPHHRSIRVAGGTTSQYSGTA